MPQNCEHRDSRAAYSLTTYYLDERREVAPRLYGEAQRAAVCLRQAVVGAHGPPIPEEAGVVVEVLLVVETGEGVPAEEAHDVG
eukprot:scaffold137728_cov102-Phaeocystis_antarctica.AAC.2